MKRAFLAVLFSFGLVITTAGAALANHWEETALGDPIHWTDKPPTYPLGYIYWVDNTGAEWPVYTSAVEWDRASRLSALYSTSEAACPNTGHCVSVNEATLGTTACGPLLGETTKTFYATTGHLNTATNVRVDTACSGSPANQRRTITCHEMGHSIGMDEQNVGTSTCMRSPYIGPYTVPSQHDFDAIASVYNHND